MGRNGTAVLYFALMVATIVAIDFLFFRHRIRERLIANIVIVLAFATFYIIFLKRT